jgi:hypothetical protein
MMGDDEDELPDYETGPFCQHWSYAYDCDRVCAKCGRTCARHDDVDDAVACDEFEYQEGT